MENHPPKVVSGGAGVGWGRAVFVGSFPRGRRAYQGSRDKRTFRVRFCSRSFAPMNQTSPQASGLHFRLLATKMWYVTGGKPNITIILARPVKVVLETQEQIWPQIYPTSGRRSRRLASHNYSWGGLSVRGNMGVRPAGGIASTATKSLSWNPSSGHVGCSREDATNSA
jgi:hypothetical protein